MASVVSRSSRALSTVDYCGCGRWPLLGRRLDPVPVLDLRPVGAVEEINENDVRQGSATGSSFSTAPSGMSVVM